MKGGQSAALAFSVSPIVSCGTDNDLPTGRQEGADKLIERYIGGGTFDSGHPRLARFQPQRKILLRKTLGRPLASNRQGHLNSRVEQLTFFRR